VSLLVAACGHQASQQAMRTGAVASASAPTASQPATVAPTLVPSSAPQGEPTGDVDCTYDATFVTDVTIPDDTRLAPGVEFVKTWRVRNSGTCDWGPGFRFVFVEGEQMGGPAAVDVPPAPAGSTVDISVRLIAPEQPGSYRGRWRMRTSGGRDFGERPFVQIIVPPPATSTSPLPTARVFPQPDLDITLVSGNLALRVGQPLALRVTVHNRGLGATDRPALVRIVVRAGVELESSVPSLPAGAQAVAVLGHAFDAPADLEAFISVDPEGDISEENESNNSARVPIVVNPPLYASRTVVATPGLRFDLDDGAGAADTLDIEWRVVEGTVYLGLLNGAGAARLSGEIDSVSYALAAGMAWETQALPLDDLAEGSLFGFRTSEGRVGYAVVSMVLDAARTGARLDYLVWDWP
jgi:hypothetical protein